MEKVMKPAVLFDGDVRRRASKIVNYSGGRGIS